jgi:hypothetical protein
VSKIFTYSVALSYFTVQQRGEISLWQLENVDRGNFGEMSIFDIAATKPLHLLPFDHCGKITDTTRLSLFVS